MNSKKRLDYMSANIGKAIREYHKAITENLKELGKPVKIQSEDLENAEGLELCIKHNGGLIPVTFDSIRWNEEKNDVFVHYTEYDYCSADEKMYLSDLGDAIDYLLEAIDWPTEVTAESNARDIFTIITLDRYDLKEHLGIKDPEKIDDATMEAISDEMAEWFMGDFPQALRSSAWTCGVKSENNDGEK